MTDEQVKQAKAEMLASKTSLSGYEATTLLMRWDWNYDVSLAVWTLANTYHHDVLYTCERLRWLRDA